MVKELFDLPIAQGSERVMTDEMRAFYDKAKADAAEVERLRAENERRSGQANALGLANNLVKKLQTDVAALEARETFLLDQVGKLIAEQETVLKESLPRLKATLAWFEEREPAVRQANAMATQEGEDCLDKWEREHPRRLAQE